MGFVRSRPSNARSVTLAAVTIAALAIAYGTVVQRPGWTQSAHYALVRALESGTPRIDAYQRTTGDKAYRDGHFYSVKAPGVAFVSLPPYLAMHALDRTPSDRTAIWILNLFTTIPFAVALLLLVRRVADELEPGTGTLVAFTLGAATLILPFATLYFSHVAAATLGFAAFYVLFRARSAPTRLPPFAVAGFLAGLACVFEYPSAIVCIALAAYALGRDRAVSRIAAYGVGGLVGLIPLLSYNTWAFGNPLSLSYRHTVLVEGASGHAVVATSNHGLFGITEPSLRVISQLLLENRGLLTLTPVVAAALAGSILLYRRGRRAESVLFVSLAAAFLIYNSGLTTPFGGAFGGATPGPRYLIGALPFVLAPLGLTYRRSPGTTIALTLISFATMALATITDPMIESVLIMRWPKDALAGMFQATVISIAGGPTGYVAALPFAVLLFVALVATGLSLPHRDLQRRDLVEGATAVAFWLVVASVARALVVPEPTVAVAASALILAAAAIIGQVMVIRAAPS